MLKTKKKINSIFGMKLVPNDKIKIFILQVKCSCLFLYFIEEPFEFIFYKIFDYIQFVYVSAIEHLPPPPPETVIPSSPFDDCMPSFPLPHTFMSSDLSPPINTKVKNALLVIYSIRTFLIPSIYLIFSSISFEVVNCS